MSMTRPAAATLILLLGLAASPALAQLPALRDRPLSAAERTRLSSLESQFARVSQQRSVSVNAVRAIAQALGERLTTQDPDQLIRAIDERAQELGVARTRISALERDLEAMDSMRLAQAVGPLLTAANAAIDAGDLALAESKLVEAGQRFADARGNLQGRVDQLSVREADILAQRAAVRGSAFDHLGAAALFAEAAQASPASNTALRLSYRVSEAEALTRHGSDQGDAAALARAAEVYATHALSLVSRDQAPAEWAKVERARGEVLAQRGQLHNDADALREGIAALRLAVEATPRASVQEWIVAQASLAAAVSAAGVRAGDQAMAQEGAALFRAAAAAGPLPNTRTRLNYAAALTRLSAFGGDGRNLEEANQMLIESVAATDRAESPRDWTELQRTRATVLGFLAQTRNEPARNAEALSILREASQVVDRRQSPVRWARFQAALGAGLLDSSQALGDAGGPTLVQAEASLRAALEVQSLERTPSDWMPTQDALARTLRARGLLDGGIGKLEEAAAVVRAMAPGAPRERSPLLWMESQSTLADILIDIAERSQGSTRQERLDEARRAYEVVASAAATASHAEFIVRSSAGLARIQAVSSAAPT